MNFYKISSFPQIKIPQKIHIKGQLLSQLVVRILISLGIVVYNVIEKDTVS